MKLRGFSADSWQNALDLAAEMKPELDFLERKRRGHLLFLLIGVPLSCLVVLPAAYFLGLGVIVHNDAAVFGFAIVAGLAVSGFLYKSFDHDYRRRAKRRFMYKIAEALQMKYAPRGFFRAGAVYDHYLFPAYDRDTAEDGFKFSLAERPVEMQEIILRRIYDREHWRVPRFLPKKERGVVVRIQSIKKQDFHTVIVPRTVLRGGYHRGHFRGMEHYERTPFGNPHFAGRYTVLSEDHTDAHDIFNPAFIEAFLAFEKALAAKSLSLSLKGRDIVFYARGGRDMFEPGHLLQPVSSETIRRIFEDLAALNNVIETLKLNPFTGI